MNFNRNIKQNNVTENKFSAMDKIKDNFLYSIDANILKKLISNIICYKRLFICLGLKIYTLLGGQIFYIKKALSTSSTTHSKRLISHQKSIHSFFPHFVRHLGKYNFINFWYFDFTSFLVMNLQ